MYQQFTAMDIYDLVRRWHRGQGLRAISRALNLDRKTVRRYLALAQKAGISRELPLLEKDFLLPVLATFIPNNERPQPARNIFEPYRDEISALLNDASDPLKPKTAFEVICLRHTLATSYSTFKRFIRDAQLGAAPKSSTCRFETPAGEELQLDYGRMGLLVNPLTHKSRVVHAFIATLSFSRLKYVEFVFTQDQKSFVASHQRMFEFFGAVPKRLVIDNLKSGVLKPDLYDPKFNRLYQELAEHYGFFIASARVRHPQDKGKVERAVPLVRELFRKLKALEPNLEMARANRSAHDWAVLDNGMKAHGTTGLLPYEVFQQLEKPALLLLPQQPFESATWKEAKVHADQFIQFEKKFYSLPQAYIGKSVWVRGSEKMVEIYDAFGRIRQYSKSRQARLFEPTDFPENVQLMLGEHAIQTLLARAAAIGPAFKQLLVRVLEPHAKLNFRRALGLLNFYPKYPTALLEAAAEVAMANQIFVPQLFKRLLEKLAAPQEPLPLSAETQEFVRPAEYFIH